MNLTKFFNNLYIKGLLITMIFFRKQTMIWNTRAVTVQTMMKEQYFLPGALWKRQKN